MYVVIVSYHIMMVFFFVNRDQLPTQTSNSKQRAKLKEIEWLHHHDDDAYAIFERMNTLGRCQRCKSAERLCYVVVYISESSR